MAQLQMFQEKWFAKIGRPNENAILDIFLFQAQKQSPSQARLLQVPRADQSQAQMALCEKSHSSQRLQEPRA